MPLNRSLLARRVPVALLLACGLVAGTAQAQDEAAPGSAEYLDRLKACQQVAEDGARLACFDAAVGRIITASDAGDVQVIDREDVRQTRRSLFGFSLPNLGILGSNEEATDELFTTTIASVRYTGRSSARVTTAEGAVWEMNNIPSNRRDFEAGDTVEFKEASLGFYFLRIDGQTGVKGRRVQ